MSFLSKAEGPARTPRPFTRRQARQNARFLDALARTGNSRLAARLLGVHRSTYTKRRAKSPLFAAQWDMALAAAHARLHKAGEAPPEILPGTGRKRADWPVDSRALEGEALGTMRSMVAGARSRQASRTQGYEPVIVRLESGRHQLRLARPGRMTRAAEQAFLRALSASANVRLSAAAAGFSHSAFYLRARKSPAFAREMRLALEIGYTRVEAAALMAAAPESHEDDGWRHNDPPPIPPMTASQALQLLALHQKRVELGVVPDPLRRRRGESPGAKSMRLALMHEARLERDREAYRVAEAARGEPDNDPEDGEGIAPLPQLDKVTGWSKATGKPPHNADLAMFGGWRIGDWEKRRR